MMGKLFLWSSAFALFAFVGVASFDTLLEVNAQIPKRVDVSLSKMFTTLELTSDLYKQDVIFPSGIRVDIRSNQASPFEVALFSPKSEEGMFLLKGDDGTAIPFFLVDSRDGRRLLPNSVLYIKEELKTPESIEISLDLVVPRQDGSIPLSKSLRGHIGINIQDI